MEECKLRIDSSELRVVLFSFMPLCKTLDNCHLLLKNDKTSKVISINKLASIKYLEMHCSSKLELSSC